MGLDRDTDDVYPDETDCSGDTGLDSCLVCGTPLETNDYCPSCSEDRAAAEPFVLQLAGEDEDDAPDTEPCPAPPCEECAPPPPIDLGSIAARLAKAGAPSLIVSNAIGAVRRAQTLAVISIEGIPIAEAPARSGVAFDARGLSWVIYRADDLTPMLEVEELFARAVKVVEGCGYIVSRRSARELWADVYEPAQRGAA